MGELVVLKDRAAIQMLIDLEGAGACDEVSLVLTDANMSYDRWESLGVFLGNLGRRVNWYIGDWINFGEAIFGQEASQAIESTTRERYSQAERVTGLDHGTLLNISSICRKVARSRRRKELPFWMHADVAALEPEEQAQWLERAVENAWRRSELRDAIKGVPSPSQRQETPARKLTPAEHLEEAARRVFHQGQPMPDGSIIVPGEVWAAFAAALGEE